MYAFYLLKVCLVLKLKHLHLQHQVLEAVHQQDLVVEQQAYLEVEEEEEASFHNHPLRQQMVCKQSY